MNDLSLLYPCHICIDNFVCGAFFTSSVLSSDSTNSYLKENTNNIVVDSGRDNETLVGGLGNDIFVMNPSGGTVSIIDFDPEVDKIDLGHFDVSFKQVIGSIQEMLSGCTIKLNETKAIEIKSRTDFLEKGCEDFIKEEFFIKLLPELTQTTHAKENFVKLQQKLNQSSSANGYPNDLVVIMSIVVVATVAINILNAIAMKIFQGSVDDHIPIENQGPVEVQRLEIAQMLKVHTIVDNYYAAIPAA
jgi:hypothetical protein